MLSEQEMMEEAAKWGRCWGLAAKRQAEKKESSPYVDGMMLGCWLWGEAILSKIGLEGVGAAFQQAYEDAMNGKDDPDG
jgi:hypothetical protein